MVKGICVCVCLGDVWMIFFSSDPFPITAAVSWCCVLAQFPEMVED